MSKTIWEVQTYTLCDGWVNTWTENDVPVTFDTYEAAKAEFDQYWAELQQAVEDGEIEPYDEDEFHIVAVEAA